MLRASGKVQGNALDVGAVRRGADGAAQSGIPHAELLVRFADALVAHEDAELAELRGPIIEAVGPEGFLEVASVAANFQRMVRIADATGIPQEAGLATLAGGVIEELSLREFSSAANTPESGVLQHLIGKLLRPFAPRILGFVGGMAERRVKAASRSS